MNLFRKLVMSEFSPEVLLSTTNRERCVANLKEFPKLQYYKSTSPESTAAVLVPICVVNGEVSLLYTLRSSQLKRNSGQVSFPGGKCDKGESFFDTALRETEEEVGFPAANIEIWGKMQTVQGRLNMLITPVVGLLNDFDMTKLKPNTDEVESVFTVTIQDLCNPINHGHLEFEKVSLPVFLSGNHKIWGLTGMITFAFLKCFAEGSIGKCDFLGRKFEYNELLPSKL